MFICGIQKLSLLDYPGKICCTVFLRGCNMRCPFCHNASIALSMQIENQIKEEDFFAFLKRRKGLLDGVCISGGEPLLYSSTYEFAEKIKNEGYLVKLDTNGTNPERLENMIKSGAVDYVAMDIKNCIEKYPLTSGIKDIDTEKIKKSAKLLMQGNVPFEFRTTVVDGFHTKEDIVKIGEWLRGAPRYYLQPFVDSGDIIKSGLSALSKEEMLEMKALVSDCFGIVEIRG